MDNKTQKKHLPNHYTVTEFAKAKGVSRAVVYNHINDGKIVTDLVGFSETVMIDWEAYKDYQFATPKWSAETFKEKNKAEEHG